MKGDFARYTFDPSRNYSRVLQQQGRVLLEADWNESTAIQLHLLRTLVRDLVGPCWAVGDGFSITDNTTATKAAGNAPQLANWQLTAGHCYVDGILCVNTTDCTLAQQPNAPTPDDGAPDDGAGANTAPATFALWLDVWERHLCAVEASEIADPALEGVETASRAQVVWQLRVLDLTQPGSYVQDVISALQARPPSALVTRQLDTLASLAKGVVDPLTSNSSPCALARALLQARATFARPGLCAQLTPAQADGDPCAIAPDARYRGCENQLYRVEIHEGGPAGRATFKWSRENGSVVFAITAHGPATVLAGGGVQMEVTVGSLGRDARLGLAVNDWVELVDDPYTLGRRAYRLLQVTAIDVANCSVTLAASGDGTIWPLGDAVLHPLLRRWDQCEGVNAHGVLAVLEGSSAAIPLEAGIQITFAPGGLYATGDYWLVPARVANDGQLDWPAASDGTAATRPPRGRHHHAVLGVNDTDGYRACCCRFDSLCAQMQAAHDPQSKAPQKRPDLAASPATAAAAATAPAPAPTVSKASAKTTRGRKRT